VHLGQLARRSLTYYRRTHIAVVLGVATAVAVLAGALLVGDSVRGSLRELVLGRLGHTRYVVASAAFFREALAAEVQGVPLVVAQGVVTLQESGEPAGPVRVYGVDDRFWRFHGVRDPSGPTDRDALVSPALAAHLGAGSGTTILVRVQRPTDVPLESLHGRKDDVGRTLRLTVRAVVPRASLGEFSLEPQQGEVRAVFVPLRRLQEELEVAGRVNTVLVGSDPTERVRSFATLDDLGFDVRALPDRGVLVVGSRSGLLDDQQAAAARAASATTGLRATPVFTYLVNTLRAGSREIPYSLITATDLRALDARPALGDIDTAPIVLNRWAADALQARVGDPVTLEYYVWEEPGRLATRSSAFTVAGVVPIEAGDRDLAPTFPGITESRAFADWDPPFPIDLRRIGPEDEAYWERYRTTPKAFVPLETGERLWRSRYGALTSLRASPAEGQPLEEARAAYVRALRATADPLATGLAVRDVRAEGLDASRGATDFGAYFTYFSIFIVVSALVLAALFFRLGIEQRAREVGLLRAVGFGPGTVRRLFLREGFVLALAGSALGIPGALGYAAVIMHGLRSWWIDAVGTTALSLHVSWLSLSAGAAGGVLSAMACVWWTLRSLGRLSERTLLAGEIAPPSEGARQLPGRALAMGLAAASAAVVLLALAAADALPAAGAFFGAGALLMIAALCGYRALLARPPRRPIHGAGWRPVLRLGLRSASYRPGRSVLSMAVIASATFILVSVDAFRRDGRVGVEPAGGTGGYALLVETLLPIVHDPNTDDGRDAIGLFSLDEAVTFEPMRLLPGDDASCLNLYAPRNPRILAPSDGFLQQGRFSFQDSLGSTDAERANPWLLLRREEADGAVPVIADANSLAYVLHRRVGDVIAIPYGGGELRLRVVAALRDSIFQSELLMSDANFVRLFPEHEGFRVLLVGAPADATPTLGADIERALLDVGGTVTGTAERLARYHQVENTYLSTFQTLGGLGLLLGTIGLAAVLLRNVLERRRELALLGAVGYRPGHFLSMVLAENALLVGGGVIAGAACALLAIVPAALERGGRLPFTSSLALLLFAVVATGLVSSIVATRVVLGEPLLPALRSE
jgi:ABC-type lipoprotein release transport system permease subunit